MPVWSLAELEACRARLYPRISPEAMLTSFTWFGGSVRRVLAVPTDQPEIRLKERVRAKSVSELVRAMSDPAMYQADFSHTLGHFKVCHHICWGMLAGVWT
jgi:hypothetical protein